MNIDRHKVYAIDGRMLDRIQRTARMLMEDWNLQAGASFDKRRLLGETLLYLIDQAEPFTEDKEDV